MFKNLVDLSKVLRIAIYAIYALNLKICDYEKENFILKNPIIDSKLIAIKNNNI